MTPFIVWLNKNEIDELITLMVKSINSNNLKKEVFSTDELVQLAESLLEQNERLIKIFKKIKPLNSNEEIRNLMLQFSDDAMKIEEVLNKLILNKKVK